MNHVDIYLNSMEDVIDFVKCAGRHPYDMDLVDGNSMVDAKSVMGVLEMAVGKKVQLRIYNEQTDDLLQELKPFMTLEKTVV